MMQFDDFFTNAIHHISQISVSVPRLVNDIIGSFDLRIAVSWLTNNDVRLDGSQLSNEMNQVWPCCCLIASSLFDVQINTIDAVPNVNKSQCLRPTQKYWMSQQVYCMDRKMDFLILENPVKLKSS